MNDAFSGFNNTHKSAESSVYTCMLKSRLMNLHTSQAMLLLKAMVLNLGIKDTK